MAAASAGVESGGRVGESAPPRVVILGDSLTAGYGVDPGQAFPARLQSWIREAGFPHEVVNAGVSGDTTAGGLRRLNWILRRPAEVLLIELGGNDGLRGLAPDSTRSNLVSIIGAARAKYPGVRVVLAGMQMPPNMGETYRAAYEGVFPSVAREQNAVLIPHLLEGVGGRPELNLPDLIHPTPEGHAVVASNVWKVLKPVLEVRDPAR
ncbi:MAG: arylesterase [Verrucomicrobiales bacterium]|nr:arylesterase [Verrucomicrobiales bacterium]